MILSICFTFLKSQACLAYGAYRNRSMVGPFSWLAIDTDGHAAHQKYCVVIATTNEVLVALTGFDATTLTAVDFT